MDGNSPEPKLLTLTSQIVAAYVSKNAVPAADVPALIELTHKTLTGLGTLGQTSDAAAPVPAVPVKKSVFADFIVCLEDGKKLKMLKRHLATSYGMTPEQYREKWQLPPDYPMVAPNYAERRSKLAKKIGLGLKRAPAHAPAAPSPEPTPEPARRVGRGRRPAMAAG